MKRTVLKLISVLFMISCLGGAVQAVEIPVPAEVFQDQIRVTGKVVDPNGEPLIGAMVVEVGNESNGATTNIDGDFELSVPRGSTLSVSYVGYKSVNVSASAEYMTITLAEDSVGLDAIVVVGYGVQKKVNVIGSISTVDSRELQSRAASDVSNMLTGLMPGVTITQSSGSPGQDSGTIRVRGVGSFGATPNPLVLVDGLPGSLSDLLPADIENISVLKDASSAAIYGSRAANGVILVTTKRGASGKVNVTYNGSAGLGQATELPEMAHSYEYAEFYNMALPGTYSDAVIEQMRKGTDPDVLADERYLEKMIGGRAAQTKHEISVSGGSENVQYMLSTGYLRQNGLIKGNHYDRYNVRANLNAKLLETLTLKTSISGVVSGRYMPSTPSVIDSDGYGALVSNALRYPGLWPTKLSNGEYGNGPKSQGTPLAWLESGSFQTTDLYKFNGNFDLSWQPVNGLTLKAIGGYQYSMQHSRSFRTPITLTGSRTLGQAMLDDAMYITAYKTAQFLADYSTTIGKHSFGVLAGYTWEDESQRTLSGSRVDFPSNDLPYLTAGGADGQTNAGGGYDWAIQSFIGRVNYNYDERYLFEASIRYDGSSRFPTANRYGVFPSVAAGWRLSEEPFWKNTPALEFFSKMKLKASYGILGNNNIGNYPYQSTYALGSGMNYVFGDSYTQGAAITTYVDPTLHWEQTATTDVGVETGFFQSKLTFNASYFYRKTTNVLYTPTASVSSIFGLTAGQVNTGSLENKGWEFELGYQNRTGAFSYHANANFSIIQNKLLTLGIGNVEQPNGMVGNGSNLFVGYPISMYYGYKTDGVFLTDDEYKQYGVDQSSLAAKWQAGDIRYVDVSGDGKITADQDRVYLGSSIPKYTFGMNAGFEWKGFDFSMLVQGVAGVKGQLSTYAAYAFYQEGNIQKWQMENCWNVQPSNRYPLYPRLEVTSNSGSGNIGVSYTSDWWVLDAWYVKVRNVQVGYNLPKSVTRRFGSTGLRFYVSLDNPLSFNDYRKGWDPEISTGGSYYPIMSVYTLGLTLKF